MLVCFIHAYTVKRLELVVVVIFLSLLTVDMLLLLLSSWEELILPYICHMQLRFALLTSRYWLTNNIPFLV
jgi:hypothetical protein